MRRLMTACLLLAACGPGVTRVAITDRPGSLYPAGPDPTNAMPAEPPTTSPTLPVAVTTTTVTPTTTTDPPRPTQPVSRGSSRSPNWEALRQCESGGDYADKRNPNYRGAYQFSYRTWASVGGEGDPADAPPDEQDMRAQMLYERSGAGQWPNCGRYL